MTTYKNSGVDIEACNKFVDLIKPIAKATARPGTAANLGGFGAVFDILKLGYQDPLLVSATDGVGTKLEIAIEVGKHDSIGIDLVAMCVNDIIVHGAEPLFFLDYFAMGKLEKEVALEIVSGIAKGCSLAGCALIGGETAEMPGTYAEGKYDLAGFSVGLVERKNLITGKTIVPGDVMLGLASNGLHANGFSLVRHIIKKEGLSYKAELLQPTRIYVKSCLEVFKTSKVKGLSHITGGGLLENIPRILPEGVAVRMPEINWIVPDIFSWVGMHGGISFLELFRTFNLGVGMVVIVAEEDVSEVTKSFVSNGEFVMRLGDIVEEDKEQWPRGV